MLSQRLSITGKIISSNDFGHFFLVLIYVLSYNSPEWRGIMKLRLETGFIYPKNVSIMDVEEIDENLAGDYGVRCGLHIDDYMYCEDFFKRIKKACFNGFITRLDCVDGIYNLGYLESGINGLVSREVEFDLTKTNEEFQQNFATLLLWYQKNRKKVDKKCFRKLVRDGDPKDALFKCYNFISQTAREKEVAPLNVDELYLFHDYLPTLLWRGAIGRFEKYGTIFMYFVSFLVLPIMEIFCFLAFGDLTFLFQEFCLTLGCWLVAFGLDKFCGWSSRMDALQLLSNVESEWGEYYDLDFTKRPVISKNVGLVDFIRRDLECCDYANREALDSLAEEYSKRRSEEYFARENELDRYSYLERLVNIEIEMCDENSCGSLTPDNLFLDSSDIKSRLRFLGFSDEQMENDCFVKTILNAINGIFYYPYDGCEVEILKLFKVAMQYGRAVADSSLDKVSLLDELRDRIIECAQRKREATFDMMTSYEDLDNLSRVKPADSMDSSKSVGRQIEFKPVK